MYLGTKYYNLVSQEDEDPLGAVLEFDIDTYVKSNNGLGISPLNQFFLNHRPGSRVYSIGQNSVGGKGPRKIAEIEIIGFNDNLELRLGNVPHGLKVALIKIDEGQAKRIEGDHNSWGLDFSKLNFS